MAGQRNVSAAIVAESEARSYVFKVHGYSRLKELFKNGQRVTSSPFSVGAHNWALYYYPNGCYARDNGSRMWIYLVRQRQSADAKDMNTKATSIAVLDKDGLPLPTSTSFFPGMIEKDILFEAFCPGILGLRIDRQKFEQSGHIIDDCFCIKCDLTLTLTLKKKIQSEETVGNQFVVVPPTDLHRHFGNLLESMDGADVTFHVGGENILAHRIVLAARSSVFKAELLGAMKENVGSPIQIHEMEADVFKSLIHFIYTDSLPIIQMTCNQGEARPDVVMAGHLLVAADRYNIDRLKLICEDKLCSHIDANMVATSLALAEQHSCNGLKEACLQFLASPSNLEAMMASDGYQHLKTSCPSALRELIIRLLPVELKAAKDIVMAI